MQVFGQEMEDITELEKLTVDCPYVYGQNKRNGVILMEKIKNSLEEIDRLAEGGLCSVNFSTAREYLKDVRAKAQEAIAALASIKDQQAHGAEEEDLSPELEASLNKLIPIPDDGKPAEQEPHRIMTGDEYVILNIQGWHMVHKNYDSAGNVGIRYIGASTNTDSKAPIDERDNFRMEFERSFEEEGASRYKNGDYMNTDVQIAWKGWQAAMQHENK